MTLSSYATITTSLYIQVSQWPFYLLFGKQASVFIKTFRHYSFPHSLSLSNKHTQPTLLILPAHLPLKPRMPSFLCFKILFKFLSFPCSLRRLFCLCNYFWNSNALYYLLVCVLVLVLSLRQVLDTIPF